MHLMGKNYDLQTYWIKESLQRPIFCKIFGDQLVFRIGPLQWCWKFKKGR